MLNFPEGKIAGEGVLLNPCVLVSLFSRPFGRFFVSLYFGVRTPHCFSLARSCILTPVKLEPLQVLGGIEGGPPLFYLFPPSFSHLVGENFKLEQRERKVALRQEKKECSGGVKAVGGVRLNTIPKFLLPPSFPSPLAETGKKLQWQLGWDGGVSKSWSCCWLGTRVRWVCRQLAGRGQSLSHIRHLCPPMPPPTTIGEGHSAAGWTGKTEKRDGYFRHCKLSEFAADKKGNE